MVKLENILAGICCAFILWLALSYVDIISDNLKENPKHSNLNAFVLLVDYMGEEK